jgi:hypothetical protein
MTEKGGQPLRLQQVKKRKKEKKRTQGVDKGMQESLKKRTQKSYRKRRD